MKTDEILFRILNRLSKAGPLTKGKLTNGLPRTLIHPQDWDPAFALGIQQDLIQHETISSIITKGRPATVYSITKKGKKKLQGYLNQQKKLLQKAS